MDKNGATLMIDSGVGGISVLALAAKRMPAENFCFFADAANAPYGDKQPDEIHALLMDIIGRYQKRRIKAILLACNTATSAAAAALRQELDIPVIGMEPALKPAVLNSRGQVIVIATRLTIREKKFRNLLAQYESGRDIVPIACPGLMELVEKDPSGSETEAYLAEILAPYRDTAEAVVLGCTHYVFLRPMIRRLFPGLRIFDGNEGVTRHLGNILSEIGQQGGSGVVEMECSLTDQVQKDAYLRKCGEMLSFCGRIYADQDYAA